MDDRKKVPQRQKGLVKEQELFRATKKRMLGRTMTAHVLRMQNKVSHIKPNHRERVKLTIAQVNKKNPQQLDINILKKAI